MAQDKKAEAPARPASAGPAQARAKQSGVDLEPGAPPVEPAAPSPELPHSTSELPVALAGAPSVPAADGEFRPGKPPPLPGVERTPGADGRSTPAGAEPAQRRVARRRPAGPVRGKIAANDDAPSIGGLIYALDQKPSIKAFKYAGIASVVWALVGLGFAWVIVDAALDRGAGLLEVVAQPATFLTAAAVAVPIAVIWFLALLAWRSEELRLRSSTMTEVAIRLAEPDRMAEQSVASLGQAVRRQVAFMNDAVSRALGRAGELEALVHNEVSALERSYEDNERKIRGLIQELTGERHALLNTSERVTDTLKTLGTDIPVLIEKLSNQQVKLAHIIEGAGENLTALESAVGQTAGRLETTLGARTDQLQNLLEGYTGALDSALEHRAQALSEALGTRTEQLQAAIGDYMHKLDSSLSHRTESLQAVFEEYARALDTSLANRAQALDIQLVERTKSLDAAFSERLRLFDETILQSTRLIDSAVGDKARALTTALETHANTFGETIGRQAVELDETLMQGISSVRRTSENITRQSLRAIEGLANQSELLKNVSENLLTQIHGVTNRFENQGHVIMKAANALETANYKIDTTLESRHADLAHTLDRLSGKADEFGRFVEGYSSSIEGSLSDAETRARAVAEQLRIGTESTTRAALADIERFRTETGVEGDRALEELRRRFSSVSTAVNEQLDSLASRFDQTSDEVRQRAQRAAADIAAEQARLREQMEQLPVTTRESADAMRRALQDQLRALEQLSNLTSRTAHRRDVAPPLPSVSLSGAYSYETHASGGHALPSLSPSVASELMSRPHAPRPPDLQRAGLPPALPRPAPQYGAVEPRDHWTLGDLLARASRDEDGNPAGAMAYPGLPFHHSIDVIARALDPATTAAIWSRINAGQRGVMVRSIYSTESRPAFDDVKGRYHTDPELQRTVNRYLADFERIRHEAELKDPSGQLAHNHQMSDMGRVYLFLAHASGRIT